MQIITIEPVLNGFIVTVGCQRVVFTTLTTMLTEIVRYQASPQEVEKEYISNALNKSPKENKLYQPLMEEVQGGVSNQ